MTTNEQPTHPVTLPPDVSETRLVARRGLLSVIEDAAITVTSA